MPAPRSPRLDAAEPPPSELELGAQSGEETDAASTGLLAAGPARSDGRRWVRVAVAACAATAAAAGLLAASGAPRARPAAARAGDAVGKSGLLEALAGGDDVEEKVRKLEDELEEVRGELFDPAEGSSQGDGPLRRLLRNGTWGRWAQDASNHERMRLLLGANDLYDGNACPDDEEAHAGLCYKKCSLLTGDHPVRTSAFSCCRQPPCTLLNQKVKFRICSGFDVAGDNQGGGCPHNKGACYVDEEMHADRCYKKCSLLTSGEYMFRSAPETCCKYSPLKSIVPCLVPQNIKTRQAFAAGGGELEPGRAANATRAAPSHYPRAIAAEAHTVLHWQPSSEFA